jgi:hypothetical protein
MSWLMMQPVLIAGAVVHQHQATWPPPASSGQQTSTAQAAAVAADDIGSCHDVASFGALGDGEHDDTSAFQKAADAADAAGGGCVRVPPVLRGKGFVLTSTVTLAPGVKLVGDANGFPEVPHAFGPPGDVNTTGGSRILARAGLWGEGPVHSV